MRPLLRRSPKPPAAPARDPQLPPGSWRRSFVLGFAIVTALVLVLLILIHRPLLRPVLWAAALATLVYPAHQRILRIVGGRPTLAAVLSTAAGIGMLVVPGILVVNQLLSEARDLWPRLSAHMQPTLFVDAADRLHASPLRRLAFLAFKLPDNATPAALEERLRSGVEALTSFIVESLRDFTLGAPAALVQTSITIVTFFFFLRHGPHWIRNLRETLPLPPQVAHSLLETVALTIKTVFRGVLLTAASQAALATLGYTVVGAPVPVLLGFLTFLTALLPFVGAAAVWLPTAIGLYAVGKVGAAIGLAFYGTLVISLVDNFLRPILIGQGMRLPILWLFLVIIGGLQSFGFLGILLGPAALALFLACVRIYQQARRVDPSTGGDPESRTPAP